MPLSTIFQLYRDDYWCVEGGGNWITESKQTCPVMQVADKLDHSQCCIEYTSQGTGFKLTT